MYQSKINLISTFFFGLLLLGFTSCSNFVEGFEEDPNNAADAPIEAVLNAAFTGTIVAHEGEDARLATLWSRQFTGSDRQYSGFEIYNINAESFDWDKYYLVAENSKIVIEKAEKTNNKLASGIAKILTAHSIGMASSLWGDVPLTQANDFLNFPTPLLDAQADVYTAVQGLLDEGISDLSDNPVSPVIAGVDFYFGGDPANWVAVANSLKARFYLHVGNYSAALEAASKGVASTAANWVIPHTSGSYNQDMNMYHSFGILDREGYMTANNAYLPQILDAAAANYRGNSKTDETARFNHIYTGSEDSYDLNYAGMWAATAPFDLVSYVEVQLILAETEWRVNSDTDAALAHLNNVRTELAAQFPDGTYEAYELADFEAGGIAAKDGLSAADALLYEIMEEKYVSLVGQIEVYNDVRRTDNFMGLSAVTGSQLPERFLYPQDEIDTNPNMPDPIPSIFEPTAINK